MATFREDRKKHMGLTNCARVGSRAYVNQAEISLLVEEKLHGLTVPRHGKDMGGVYRIPTEVVE